MYKCTNIQMFLNKVFYVYFDKYIPDGLNTSFCNRNPARSTRTFFAH